MRQSVRTLGHGATYERDGPLAIAGMQFPPCCAGVNRFDGSEPANRSSVDSKLSESYLMMASHPASVC